MFTLDWCGSEDEEEGGDGGHKCAHVIALDNGNFAAQPSNRIQWFCPAFVTPFDQKPDYVTNTRIWKVERETETPQAFFYDCVVPESGESARPSQLALRERASHSGLMFVTWSVGRLARQPAVYRVQASSILVRSATGLKLIRMSRRLLTVRQRVRFSPGQPSF